VVAITTETDEKIAQVTAARVVGIVGNKNEREKYKKKVPRNVTHHLNTH
jgi:hypothetical protein